MLHVTNVRNNVTLGVRWVQNSAKIENLVYYVLFDSVRRVRAFDENSEDSL